MSTDRELLDAAARAAGIELDWDGPPNSPPWRMTGEGEDRGPASEWNPLTDDGDALRLAVKLDMRVFVGYVWGKDVGGFDAGTIRTKQDPYAATRRAIVRAAAALADKQ